VLALTLLVGLVQNMLQHLTVARSLLSGSWPIGVTADK